MWTILPQTSLRPEASSINIPDRDGRRVSPRASSYRIEANPLTVPRRNTSPVYPKRESSPPRHRLPEPRRAQNVSGNDFSLVPPISHESRSFPNDSDAQTVTVRTGLAAY